ncbi:MAG: arginine--tRNA ligase [Patescibacteria group bacterium]
MAIRTEIAYIDFMIQGLLKHRMAAHWPGVNFDILIPDDPALGDYSTNIAFTLAQQQHQSPADAAERVIQFVKDDAVLGPVFEKVVFAAPGFVNFFLKASFLQQHLADIYRKRSAYGSSPINKGKTVMVEYTDPNPFKQFHIGHLMSNAIGETIARLYEATGAKVIRVNWQGDAGLHIAMAVWGMQKGHDYLGPAYTFGARAYQDNPEAKKEIEAINKKLYDRSDSKLNMLYQKGREGSLRHFETLYQRLGTKFTHYFFESEMAPRGVEIVRQHPDVFEASEGATIFRGEKYGLHTRVFINAQGLPTYEAKELGLNQEKFRLYKPDLSLIVTGNEITEYFKVLLQAMQLIMPEVASRTRHVPHGMLRLPSGKMSSRTGEVVPAEQFIDEVKTYVDEKLAQREGLSTKEREGIRESVALAAIRYTMLRQGIGRDITFDVKTAVAFEGDSGPYLQYTHARLSAVLTKAGVLARLSRYVYRPSAHTLNENLELRLIKHMLDFSSVIVRSTQLHAPNALASYLHGLATLANRYYESIHILSDEQTARKAARLVLVETIVAILKRGLDLLGIRALKRI